MSETSGFHAWARTRFEASFLRFLHRKLPVPDLQWCVFSFTQGQIPDMLSRDIRTFVWTLQELELRYKDAWPSMHEMLRHNMSFYADANNLLSSVNARRMLAAWPMGHRLRFLVRIYHNMFYMQHHLENEEVMVQWGLH